MTIPEALKNRAKKLEAYYQAHYSPLAPLAAQCFLNTMETTVKQSEDGGYFVITGDIPAMWLRDSAAQVRPYVKYAGEDGRLQEILEGIIASDWSSDVCSSDLTRTRLWRTPMCGSASMRWTPSAPLFIWGTITGRRRGSTGYLRRNSMR